MEYEEKFIVCEDNGMGNTEVLWWAKTKEEAIAKAQEMANFNNINEDEPEDPVTTYFVAETSDTGKTLVTMIISKKLNSSEVEFWKQRISDYFDFIIKQVQLKELDH